MHFFYEEEENICKAAAELIKRLDDDTTTCRNNHKADNSPNLGDGAIKTGLYGLAALVEIGSKVTKYLIDPVLNKVPNKVKYGAAAITLGVAMSFTGGAAKFIPTDVSEVLDSHIDIGNHFDIPVAYALEINESSGKAEVNGNLFDVNAGSTWFKLENNNTYSNSCTATLFTESNNIEKNEDLLTPRDLLARETNEMIRDAYYRRQITGGEYEAALVDLKLKIHSKHGEYGAVEKASKEATKLRVKLKEKDADYEQVISSIKERQIEEVFPELGEWHGLQEKALDEWVMNHQISNETLRKIRNLENGALDPLEVKTFPEPPSTDKYTFRAELDYRIAVAAYYDVTLRPYQQSRAAILLMPKDPSSYVDPDNLIVKKFAEAYHSHDKKGDELDSVAIARNFDRGFWPVTDRVLHEFTSDYHENPDFTLMIGAGDCDAHSDALASMLISKGIKAKVIGFVNYDGDQAGGGSFGHFGVEFKGEDDKVYFADTIGNADVKEKRMDFYRSFERVAFQFSNNERLNSYDKYWYQSDEKRRQRLTTINLVTGPNSKVGRIISSLEKEGEDVANIREARDIVYRATVNPNKNGGLIEDWLDSRVLELENALIELGYTIYE